VRYFCKIQYQLSEDPSAFSELKIIEYSLVFDVFPKFNLRFSLCLCIDIPAQVPPLTPGTNKKMTEALKASFASWEKEIVRNNIPKGKQKRVFLNVNFIEASLSGFLILLN